MTTQTLEFTPARLQAVREALFCEHVLAKSASNVLLTTLGKDTPVEGWAHYPREADVFDPASGAVWYYHCHLPASGDEHGHFHCFVRPEGKDGPIHHLVAISVDAAARPLRLFTVNQWVVGDAFIPAERAIELLGNFDVHMDQPSYLVNRWVSAILRLYEADIRTLLLQRARTLAAHGRNHSQKLDAVLKDRSLEVTSQLPIDVSALSSALEAAAASA